MYKRQVLAATAYDLEQFLFFPDTLPVLGLQPSNVTWRDFDLTHCTTPFKPQHQVAAWPVVAVHLLYLLQLLCMKSYVNQFGLAVRPVSKWTSAWFCFSSPFSSKRLWFVDTVLWPRPSQLTKMALIALLMQESFWWWQCSDMFIISLFPINNKTCVFCGR